MNTSVIFSSQTDEWATPQEFYDNLNKEFGFSLDPCANDSNAKCDKYYTKIEDGLIQNWGGKKCFATLLMVERLGNGLRSAIWNLKRKIQCV